MVQSIKSIGFFGALSGVVHIDQGRTYICSQAGVATCLFCQIPERTQGKVKVDQQKLYE